MKKEPEIRRMNFLNRGKAGFTYKDMITALSGWVVFLVLLIVIQFARQAGINHNIKTAKKTVEILNIEKDRQIEMVQVMGKQRVGSAVRQDLTGMIELRPLWSKVLDSLGRCLPAQVWLDAIKTSQGPDGALSLSILGKARTQRDITNFVMQIESKGLFQRTSLVKTKQIEGNEILQEFEMVTYPQMSKFH